MALIEGLKHCFTLFGETTLLRDRLLYFSASRQ
jgi:hypothetical protein